MKTLSDYRPVLRPLLHLIAKRTRLDCHPDLSEVFNAHPKLIVAINHGSPLSWLPAACLLAEHGNMSGGGQRRPIGVMDRFFFHVPGLRRIVQVLTQTDRPLSLFELAEAVESGEYDDIVVFPEGSNCFFGHPDVLQEFRSPRFVELAIDYNLPILVCAHRGSEAWAKAVEVKGNWINQLNLLPKPVFDFLESRLKKTGLLAVPLVPKPMENFEMSCELYQPELTKADLSKEPQERMQQLRVEASRVRDVMSRLLEVLDRQRGEKSLDSREHLHHSEQNLER